MSESKKALIIYQSMTGNTEKIALRFKKVFEGKGWECDIFKIDKNTDVHNPPFAFNDYDFICTGSGVYKITAGEEIIDTLFYGSHPERQVLKGLSDEQYYSYFKRIIPGPKAGIVFVTHQGAHLGPVEAEPALSTLSLLIEHLKFKCIGRFSCPGGREGPRREMPEMYYGDITDRPDERDLLNAEIFLEEKIEEYLARCAHREKFGE